MRLPTKVFPAVVLLVTTSMGAWSATDLQVNVEAMIGEATLISEGAGGQAQTLVIPTGKVTQKDPGTGQTVLTQATVTNNVNRVVQAIAAASPDADNRRPTDDGCSQGNAPHRLSPRPEYDQAAAAAIAAELEGMSTGDLMMVMAVLINNANHLCIDTATFVSTVQLISTTRQEEAANIVYVASLLDPANSDNYADVARKVAPTQAGKIDEVVKEAAQRDVPEPSSPQAKPKPTIKPPQDIPPGGAIGGPPSPE
ncbi:Uncharacterised protein [Halioglobus japonicus]|nr:Uncharacterised protein [Halioglobus japonicus]